MKNEQTPFDKALRDQLKDLEAPYIPGHWEAFEQRLDQEPGLSPEDAGAGLLFDRLRDYEVPYEKGGWDRMEALLEQEEAGAAGHFDRVAAEKLRRMEAPYDPHNWDLMARRIDEAFSIRHWLHRYHVPELALMILLVFTLVQQVNREDRSGQVQVPAQDLPVAAHASGASVGEEPLSADRSLHELPDAAVVERIASVPSLPSVAQAFASVREELAPPVGIVSLPGAGQTGEAASSLLPFAKRALSDRKAPNLEAYAEGSALAGIEAFRAFVRRPSKWYVGAYGGTDLNLILSPADEVFGTSGYLTDSLGFRAGIFVAMKRQKWSVQTGFTYAKVAYRPVLPVQQYGSFDYLVIESFEGIRYQFLQIPLEVRRGLLPDRSHWDLYLLGGVEANLISDASYDIHQQEVFSSRSSVSTADREAVSEKSRLNQKTFPQGVLNGDRFFNNIYLSFSAGVGVERTLSDRCLLFLEPVYSRPFIGHEVGPNEDQIHQFSLRLGAKVRLK